MYINPAVLIFAIAIIVFMLVFSIINKPNKPVLTFTLLILFGLFLGFLTIINSHISSTVVITDKFDFLSFMASILTAREFPTVVELEQAFIVYRNFVVFLGSACVITMIYECRRLINYAKQQDSKQEDDTQRPSAAGKKDLKG